MLNEYGMRIAMSLPCSIDLGERSESHAFRKRRCQIKLKSAAGIAFFNELLRDREGVRSGDREIARVESPV